MTNYCPQSFHCRNTEAMTLLEVILSLALLGGTVAVIGEVARNSFQNARIARDLIQAELLAESILAKIRLGIIEMEPVFDTPIGSSMSANRTDFIEDTHAVVNGSTSNVLWRYSVEINPVESISIDTFANYLVEIAVTVRQNVPEGQRAVVCRLVRWLALEPETEEEE
jgi:type II secretory pathway pseudopilin PulG